MITTSRSAESGHARGHPRLASEQCAGASSANRPRASGSAPDATGRHSEQAVSPASASARSSSRTRSALGSAPPRTCRPGGCTTASKPGATSIWPAVSSSRVAGSRPATSPTTANPGPHLGEFGHVETEAVPGVAAAPGAGPRRCVRPPTPAVRGNTRPYPEPYLGLVPPPHARPRHRTERSTWWTAGAGRAPAGVRDAEGRAGPSPLDCRGVAAPAPAGPHHPTRSHPIRAPNPYVRLGTLPQRCPSPAPAADPVPGGAARPARPPGRGVLINGITSLPVRLT